MRPFLDPLTEAAQAVTPQALAGDVTNLQPGGIGVFPHVGGDATTHCVGTGPRSAQATVDAGRVGGIEGEEMQQSLGVQVAVPFPVIVQGAGDHQGHGQLVQAVAATILRHQ